ncbi:MAG: response regulator transcription factor [Proteobacteria bacterium]|nr:response regulator transcription factor [Pseudomonadota bacterium]
MDDHTLFREGLKLLLADNPAFHVAGEAGSVEEACRKAAVLRPDIVLMDIALPDGNGIDGTRMIREQHPAIKFIMVSMYSKIEYIIQALRIGARGFMVKDGTPDMLLRALNTVIRGHYYFDPTVTEEIVHFLIDRHGEGTPVSDSNYDRLTQREQEIMRLVAQGLSTKHIAERLCISPKTVENHRAKIMVKLELENVVDLVRYAAKLGIINLRPGGESLADRPGSKAPHP